LTEANSKKYKKDFISPSKVREIRPLAVLYLDYSGENLELETRYGFPIKPSK